VATVLPHYVSSAGALADRDALRPLPAGALHPGTCADRVQGGTRTHTSTGLSRVPPAVGLLGHAPGISRVLPVAGGSAE